MEELKVVMCANCKETHEQPVTECWLCDSKTFEETHIENIKGKRELGREYFLDSTKEETGKLIWQYKGVCWLSGDSKHYSKNEMGLIPILNNQLVLKPKK